MQFCFRLRQPRIFAAALSLALLLPRLLTAADPDIRRDATVTTVEQVMPCVVNIATAMIVEYEDFHQRLFCEFTDRAVRRRDRNASTAHGMNGMNCMTRVSLTRGGKPLTLDLIKYDRDGCH